MPTCISPKYTDQTFGSNPTIEDKILVFENRVFGWNIAPAKALNSVPHAGYAIVSILFSYFEMIYQYISGEPSNNRSKEFFGKGFKEIYPNSTLPDNDIELIYSKVRCGMYHSGMTKLDTLLSGDFTAGLSVQDTMVCINPHKLVDDIESHFKKYITYLKDINESEKREKFKQSFDRRLTP